MKELEMQLRSWAPRRPSARVERRIFAQKPAPEEPAPAFRLSWLAPATAAVLLMTVLFSQHTSPAISGSASSAPMVALILSNQSAASYLPGSFQRTQNGVKDRTFEWTNVSGSTSSMRSLSLWTRGNH